jgi:hypothetical protein
VRARENARVIVLGPREKVPSPSSERQFQDNRGAAVLHAKIVANVFGTL